ncbi:alpha/beta hydrolase [Ramlibacter ginsenosidimutans]|uniref:Alpha/beta hydrolase n=1 Tax=Ramlibacter ginsenosidimutans TaxID=502333 RepID=A0A934WMB3_9BURK|nr:alpha/beta hydrolase [Ramlibacter ginsenosidimutans]MBK6006456.1 alpha/beta hydrolase [Ramlibacter ginsenosidimutans]
MSDPKLNYVSCPDSAGSHRMAYWQWGDPAAAHVVVCVHGLSRQGRDFDTLAQALVARSPAPLRVVCPDVVGRGRSDWLADPMGYGIPTYVGDMLQMLQALHASAPVTTLDWVGTSMGGLIGMGLAGTPGLPLPAPVRRLVLNDVGPVIQWSALQRIGTYLGQTGRFGSVQEAADAMWAISQGFGPHTPEQWLALSQPMVKPLPAGGFTLHYDPAIAVPFRTLDEQAAAAGQAALWQAYDAIQARTLLLRGAQSDLLSRATADEMARRGPKPRVVEFAGVGHAPTLIAPEQVEAVCAFLLAPDSATDEKPFSGTG